MDNNVNNSGPNRRDALKLLGMGSAAGLFGMLGGSSAKAAPAKDAHATGNAATADHPGGGYSNKGLPPLKIKSVKATGTAPEGANLVVANAGTTDPGRHVTGSPPRTHAP